MCVFFLSFMIKNDFLLRNPFDGFYTHMHTYCHSVAPSFSATVTNLQAKMETLITTNALMKEDLAIAKNTIMHMQDDNDRLRKDKGLPTQQQQEQLDKEVRTVPTWQPLPLYAMISYLLTCYSY